MITPADSVVTLPRTALYIYTNNKAPSSKTILLFPGWTFPIELEKAFLDALRVQYKNVLSVMPPGYRDNPDSKNPYTFSEIARELDSYLKENKLQNTIFIGFSMGCRMIMEFCDLFPEYFHVKRQNLFFLGCAPHELSIPWWGKLLLLNKPLMKLLRGNKGFVSYVNTYAIRMITEDPTAVWRAEECTPLGSYDSMLALVSITSKVQDYVQKGIFVSGEKDPFLPALQNMSPRNLHIMKNVSHNCIWSHELEIAELL
jgi:pimeloyl-ACP methyl ester carboxylesterase